MAGYKIEALPSPACIMGEGPHWDIERQSLYYNNIYGGTILRYDYAENKVYEARIDGEEVIAFIIPVKDTMDQFIIGTGKSITLISWDGKSKRAKKIKTVGEVEKDLPDNRFNDAKCDPRNRFYGGTMRLEEKGDIFEKRLGSFYRYTKSTGFVEIKKQVGISNGLTWNENTNKFYYIDSVDLDVKEYDYNPDTGDIFNERKVIDLSLNGKWNGFVPDGMTIDTEGTLYVACFGSSQILKINPSTGKILLEIKLPAEQITSVAFGGPNLDILYATSSAKKVTSEQLEPAGKLFKITGLGVRGTRMYSVALD